MNLINKMISASFALGLGLMTLGAAKPTIAHAAWQDHYRGKTYLVRVEKPTKAEKVKTYAGIIAQRTVKKVTLHKGEVVKTWYRTQGGFIWMLQGGKNGKYNGNYHYLWNVNWPSKKSFKVLKVYK